MINLRDLVKRLRGLDKRIRRLERLEGGTTNLINNSGGVLNPGDVVAIDPGVENSVRMALGNGVQGPTVVVIGGENEELVKCTKRGYGKIEITCEVGVVAVGDAIVTSAVNAQGRVDNAATARNLLGFALESKTAGVGIVLVLV